MQRELSRLQREREHKEEIDRLHSVNDNLRDKLTFSENQLVKARNERAEMELQLQDMDDRLKVLVCNPCQLITSESGSCC